MKVAISLQPKIVSRPDGYAVLSDEPQFDDQTLVVIRVVYARNSPQVILRHSR